ncbi:thymidylate kinase [Amylostereum chailletii]|nr:thymidylate kinase [Amylostereum chailletii]
MSTKRGALIVIEGLDRSGKSTQAATLLTHLASLSLSAKLQKFPDRTTPIGKMIDAFLRSESELDDRAIHLLFSANRWETAASIESTLLAGTTVLCDRYAFSGIAFSTAKGLSYAWCRAPDVGLPRPDLTLFLDVSPETARARGGYGEERYEREELQRRVREQYARIGGETSGWIRVDADQDLDVVAKEVWAHVEPLAHGVASPIQKLWTEVL